MFKKNNSKSVIIILNFLFFCVIVFSIKSKNTADAGLFNANNIISNHELEDWTSLSQETIQRFLETKKSFLSKFTEVIDGKRKTASQIIFEESQKYKINPKVILAMLQKEQSLITDQSPSQDQIDWAMGFAVCDSCSKQDPQIQQYKGFYNQVSLFAEKVRDNYLRDLKSNGKTFTGWGVGKTKTTLDGYEITPSNYATAVLYTYNPWRGGDDKIGANYNFWKIWNRYFVRSYPDGTLIQETGEAGVWLIKNGQRRPFKSRAALASRYDTSYIIQVSKNELEAYDIGPEIKFPNYSLLKDPKGNIYLLDGDNLRKIESMEVFKTIGFNPEEVVKVEEEDLKLYNQGKPITIESAYPTGALLQNNKTGAVFYVSGGTKQGIIDRTILEIMFKYEKIIPAREDKLSKYQDIGPLKLSDGTIVSPIGSPAVYVISDQKRRPVVSAEAFEKLGFEWKNVKKVPEKVINLHEIGEALDLVITYGEEEVEGENK